MKVDKRVILAILHIAVGALFCSFKDKIIGWILTLVGVAFVINGILQLSNKNSTNGVVNIVIGLLVIAFGWTLVWVAMLVFGAILLVSAIADYSNSDKDKLDLVKLIVSLALGVLLIFCGFETIGWLFIVIGVALIVEGTLQVITLIKK